MDFKILSRRAVSLCLCLCLVGLSVVPRAEATGTEGVGSLTIAAGALSTGGLTGSALVSAVAPYVVPVVAIALAGFGINAYVTEQSKQAGMTRSDYVKDTIDHFCSVSSYGAAKFYSTVAKGITIGPTGKIQLSHAASKAISQMIEWMFTQDGLVVETPSVSDGEDVYSFGDATIKVGTSFTFTDINGKTLSVLNASNPVFVSVTHESNILLQVFSFVPGTTFTYSYPSNPNLGNNSQTTVYDVCNISIRNPSGTYIYLCSRRNFILGYFSSPALIDSVSYPASSPTFSYYWQNTASDLVQSPDISVPGQDCFTGDATDYAENKDVLNPTIDNVVTTLNPDVLNKILDSLGSVATDYTMSIADYLDALTKAYDQALEDVKTGLATLTDAVTGIKEQIAIPDTATDDASITAEDTGNYDPATDDSEPNVPEVSDQFQYPLKNLFPFCIPFDLFALYSVFDADPVAPRVEINYTIPVGNGIPIHLVLDLSPWNSVAATLRAMVLVAFVAGLAVRTRRIFIQA